MTARCHSSIRLSKISLRSETGSSVVAHLERLTDHPCDLPPLMIFLRPLAISESRTSKFVSNFTLVIVYDVFRSALDFADSISLIHTIASIGRLAHEDTSLPKFISHQTKLQTQVFQLLFSGKLGLSPLVLAPTGTLELVVAVLGISRTCSTVRSVEMDRQAVTRCGERTRLHPFN